METRQLQGEHEKTLCQRKVITFIAYKEKFVFADSGKQLTAQQKLSIKQNDNGKKYLDNREIIPKNAYVKPQKANKRNKSSDIVRIENNLVYADSCTPLTDLEKQQIRIIKGRKTCQGRIVIQYGSFLRRYTSEFTSGPNIGQVLTTEQKKRIRDGFCDGFAVKISLEQSNKKRKISPLDDRQAKRSKQQEVNSVAGIETTNDTILGKDIGDDVLRNVYSFSNLFLFPPASPPFQQQNEQTQDIHVTPTPTMDA